MPTDENTQAVQQNWNPMWDPSTSSNSWNADDFDFSFDSELGTSSVWNSIGQWANQGRTWMFLTPDEEAEKEELQNSWQVVPAWQESNPDDDPALSANNGSYFPNVNINNNVTILHITVPWKNTSIMITAIIIPMNSNIAVNLLFLKPIFFIPIY